MTNKYEAAMVFSVANGEEATLALKEKFNDLIAKNGAIENVNDWGKRRLAYPINDMPEGYYVVVTFKSAPEFPGEMDRLFNIDESIMRSMIIKLDYDAAEKKAAKTAAAEEATEAVVETAEAADAE